MATIDNQLAFFSSPAFQSFTNVKNRKKFRKNFETLRKYLPADKRSFWPNELRKKTIPGCRTTVVAFSGTMGASVSFGWIVEPFLKDIKSWVGGLDKTHRDIFEAIVNNHSLRGNIEDRYFDAADLKRILTANTSWPVIRYDGMDYAVSGEDLRRLIAEMQNYRSRAQLVKISQIDEWGGTFYVLTFTITAGLSFHLLTAPTLRNRK